VSNSSGRLAVSSNKGCQPFLPLSPVQEWWTDRRRRQRWRRGLSEAARAAAAAVVPPAAAALSLRPVDHDLFPTSTGRCLSQTYLDRRHQLVVIMSCVPHELLVLSSALPLATVDLSCAARPLSPRLPFPAARASSRSRSCQRSFSARSSSPRSIRSSTERRSTSAGRCSRISGDCTACCLSAASGW
jgi:hypothetical protein